MIVCLWIVAYAHVAPEGDKQISSLTLIGVSGWMLRKSGFELKLLRFARWRVPGAQRTTPSQAQACQEFPNWFLQQEPRHLLRPKVQHI